MNVRKKERTRENIHLVAFVVKFPLRADQGMWNELSYTTTGKCIVVKFCTVDELPTSGNCVHEYLLIINFMIVEDKWIDKKMNRDM